MTAEKTWPELMTLRQMSEYLNVPLGTCQYWVYRVCTVPHVSLGSGGRTGRRLCRVRKSVLDAMIAQGERPAFRVVQGGKS